MNTRVGGPNVYYQMPLQMVVPLSTETMGTASDQIYRNPHAAEPQIKMR